MSKLNEVRDFLDKIDDSDNSDSLESIICHLVNVLQDSSMKQESRLIRVRDEVNAFLDNHPEVRI